MSSSSFELNPSLDRGGLRLSFARKQRLRIADFLQPAMALALHKHLAHEVDWRAFLCADGRLFAAPAGLRGEYPADFASQLLDRACRGARHGFAYLHEANRIFPEDVTQGEQGGSGLQTAFLSEFSAFLNSGPFLDFARTVTGHEGIQRTQIQATRHRSGHFATFKTLPPPAPGWGNCRAMFTITLTLDWAVEWGGLLEFLGADDYVVESYPPSFNVLDLFCVPQGHWISTVAPFAAGERLAISGRLYSA